ncbi:MULTISPECIES: FKBP-type peptidyl-prolyl cis-trans isomerase [Candidatus Ichthyocystis]|uniref:peptidylprolyl isomerase n=1 Tax=Candidatus Ichthyocystis hellenicum TaxID=1561003 RepID=A0A0S4M103_9BURK|nr:MULTISPECIES: DUF2187 family protein [Ichthyocystis]CUT16928.1 putative peptidyl-prolyl cis-trans isomerase [Candidatus Ichthyocystis hellenicum]
MIAIEEGSFVTLFYQIRVDRTSEVIFDTFSLTPATLLVGGGTLNYFFENCLFGLFAGDKREFLLSPAESFGHRRDDLLKTINRNLIDNGNICNGQCVHFENNGMSFAGIVRSVSDDSVLVDFNHPLAGEDIRFSVHIVEVMGKIST